MCSSRLFTNLFYILFEIKFRVALVYFIFSVCFFFCLDDIFSQQYYTVSLSQRSTWCLT